MLSSRPGAAQIGANFTGLDELQNANPGLNLQQIMKFVLLKLTLEILSMNISEHAYICGRCLFPSFYLMTNNSFECFKRPHFTTQNLNNPMSNALIKTYRQF